MTQLMNNNAATIDGVDMEAAEICSTAFDGINGEWKPAEFEPFTGQDYAKGFYRVRIGSHETWAYPNGGVFFLFSKDGKQSTGVICEPGDCEARWADEEYRQVMRAWRKAAPYRRLKKIPRNDPCVCGSGKKFKKCCRREYEMAERMRLVNGGPIGATL